MASEISEEVLEWFMGGDTAYLIGAGCSLCAGKPLIGQLTQDVLAGTDQFDPKIRKRFETLKGSGNRPPTIEDLINFLVRYEAILTSLDDTDGHDISADWIDTALTKIKEEIVGQIADDWKPSKKHELFLRRIQSQRGQNSRDIFTVNYDTVFEATLDNLKLPYSDGFRGSQYGWFDPMCFDEAHKMAGFFRIFKLHGSINWTRDCSDEVRRVVVRSKDDAGTPVVVYPSEQKYLATQYGIYETLMNYFRNRLRSASNNNRLVVLGYSFNDEHINEAIVDAVATSGSNLTVYSFIGLENDCATQEKRLKDIADRCDSRFNAFVGESISIGSALSEEENSELLKLGLWKFENLVSFIAEGAE